MLLLLSFVPVFRHLVAGVVNLLVRDDGRSQVLEEVTLQERLLVNNNVVRVVRVDHCTREYKQNIMFAMNFQCMCADVR